MFKRNGRDSITAYVDTNVIISYGLDGDANHDKALRIIEESKNAYASEFYGSTLTLLELYCTLYRIIQNYKLSPGIEQILDESKKIKATVSYLIRLLNIKIYPDEPKLVNLNDLKLFHMFYDGIQLARGMKLKTLDTLHLAYASQLMRRGVVKYFITLDSEIAKRGEDVQSGLGIKVMSGSAEP